MSLARSMTPARTALEDASPQATEPPPLSGRMPALDGLRGLAIAVVMIHHFLPYDNQPTSSIGKFFFFLASTGWCGVDLFFVLSGFLITGILLDAKGTPHYFRNFYARRTLRIFPLYYAVLAGVFLLAPRIWPRAFAAPDLAALLHRQGWLWTYTLNWPITRYPNGLDLFHGGWLFLSPYWSLAVEEHFYLIWPAVVYCCSRRALLWVCGGCIAGSLLVRLELFHLGNEWGIYMFTPSRVDALAIGGGIAAALRIGSPWLRDLSRHLTWLPFALAAVWLWSVWRDPLRDRIFAVTVGYLLIALLFAALLLRCVTAPAGAPIRRVFENHFLGLLGQYSYGLYVYHVLLGISFDHLFPQRHYQDILYLRLHLGAAAYGASVLLHILLAGTASFGIAWLSWQLMEKHFLKLKRYFESRPAASASHDCTRRTK